MRLSEHCYAVLGLAYAPPWTVNAGFVAGEQETLIVDTGANALAAATIHGYASAVRDENRLRVVNTEKHFDHIGGNGFFRELEVPIHGHAGIARTPDEFAEERSGFHPAFHYATPLVNPGLALQDGEEFDLGGVRVRVVFTPGHTATNVSVWIPAERVLYCGDCLAHVYVPNLDAAAGLADWRIWMDSLQRIEGLGADVILCGHGPVVHGEEIPAVIARVRQAIQQRMDATVSGA